MSSSYSVSPSLSTPYLGALGKLSVQTLNCTPNMAKMLRETAHFERQRPIDIENVGRLAFEIKNGWFIAGTPIFICVLPDDTMRIVNGNHTLEAVAKSGVTIPLTFIYSKVSGIEEVAKIYANLDMQKVRSWRVALQAVRPDASSFQARVMSALGVVESGFSSTPNYKGIGNSRTQRFVLLDEYQSASSLLSFAIADGSSEGRKFVERASIMAVALVTFRYQPSAAHDFWRGLVIDDALKLSDPRKALLTFLRNHQASGGSQRYVAFRAAAICWNKFFQGHELSVARPNSVNAFRLLGTPWHKGPASKIVDATFATIPRPLFETGLQTTGAGTQMVARFHA